MGQTKEQRDAIRDALAAIAAKHAGRLTPEDVVAEAEKRGSVLHDLFEWDAKKAAHAHRLYQARDLIRAVRIQVKTERTTITTVAYVRDPDAAPSEQGYVPVLSLIGDEDRARAALLGEFTRAAAALRRAKELAVAFSMVDQIEAIAETVDVMRTRVEASVEARTQ